MAKKYDIMKKSDMNRFKRDLMKDITGSIRNQAMKMKHSAKCPHCDHSVAVSAGSNICPYCRNGINLNIKFDF